MKPLANLAPNDKNSDEYVVYKHLILWAFKTEEPNTVIPDDTIPFDTISREQLPKDDAQALVYLYLCYPKIPAYEYLCMVCNNLNIDIELITYANAVIGNLAVLKLLDHGPKAVTQLFINNTATQPLFNFNSLHIKVLKWLKLSAAEDLDIIINQNGNRIFSDACSNGQIKILNWLKKFLSPEILDRLIKKNNYSNFLMAFSKGNRLIINWFLAFPQCMAKADSYYDYYGVNYINPYVDETIAALECNSTAIGINFNITDIANVKYCYYLLLILIRRKDSAVLNKIEFLLSIPALRDLVHRDVTGQKVTNEILQFALTIGNFAAAEKLLQIAEVKRLTVKNRYYFASTKVGTTYYAMLLWLQTLDTEAFSAIIKQDAERIFIGAYTNSGIDILELIEREANTEFKRLIQQHKQTIFFHALSNENIETFEWLKTKISKDEQDHIVRVGGSEAFTNAVLQSQKKYVELIKDLMSFEQLLATIRSNNFAIFRFAFNSGKMQIAQWLLSLDPECFGYAEEQYKVYGEECVYPYINSILKKLHFEFPAQATNLVLEDNNLSLVCYYILRNYIRHNEDDLNKEIQFLLTLPFVQQFVTQEEQAPRTNALMCVALVSGNCTAAALLIEIGSVGSFTKLNNFYLAEISNAAHLHQVSNWIEETYPEDFKKIIASKMQSIFTQAFIGGNLAAIKWIERKVPADVLKGMIQNNNYQCFKLAVTNNRVTVVAWLQETTPDLFEEMIKIEAYAVLITGLTAKDKAMQLALLQHPSVFTYTESSNISDKEYIINSFIGRILAALEQEKNDYNARGPEFSFPVRSSSSNNSAPVSKLKSPDKVKGPSGKRVSFAAQKQEFLLTRSNFDINKPGRAQLCFYIALTLIKNTPQGLDKDLRFLLSIPAVKTLALQEGPMQQSNALMRLALSTGNTLAADQLMKIPEIAALTRQNGFYQSEIVNTSVRIKIQSWIKMQASASSPGSSSSALFATGSKTTGQTTQPLDDRDFEAKNEMK